MPEGAGYAKSHQGESLHHRYLFGSQTMPSDGVAGVEGTLGRYRNLKTINAFFSTQILYDDRVAPTLTSSGDSIYWHEKRNVNDTEYRRMSTFPSDFDFGDAKVRYVCGMSVPPLMTAKIAEQIKLQWFESNNKLNAS